MAKNKGGKGWEKVREEREKGKRMVREKNKGKIMKKGNIMWKKVKVKGKKVKKK